MSDDLISKCALFFFLLTLDDSIANEATSKTLKLFKKQIRNIPGASAFNSTNIESLIELCLKEWLVIRPKLRREQIKLISSKALKWPEHIDLNPWKEFQKYVPENELIAVIWVHVLGVSEATLARCLNVSEGTVRYRVGRGLSLLGQLNRPNISSLQFT